MQIWKTYEQLHRVSGEGQPQRMCGAVTPPTPTAEIMSAVAHGAGVVEVLWIDRHGKSPKAA